MSRPAKSADARQYPRLKLQAMYTLVRVRPAGTKRYQWTGYIYDISQTGMRFEVDGAIPPGTKVDICALLPGAHHTTFEATGHIVRMHDDDDLDIGPVRMGMTFDSFARELDEMVLDNYLAESGLRAA
jgi:hypothetical protein